MITTTDPLRVTDHLHPALRRYRHTAHRRIWIDAIRIDQANTAKRNHQATISKSVAPLSSTWDEDLKLVGLREGNLTIRDAALEHANMEIIVT